MHIKKSIFSNFYSNSKYFLKYTAFSMIVLSLCLIKTNSKYSKQFNKHKRIQIEHNKTLIEYSIQNDLNLNFSLNEFKVTEKNIEDNLSDIQKSEITSLSNSTLNREKFLEERYGVRKKDPSFIFYMSTVYILILVCGILGNVSTCFVIFINNCMHTTTNYYLFSLAVSDVLSLITGKNKHLTVKFIKTNFHLSY